MPEKIAGAGRKWLLLANKSFSAGFFIAQPAERRGKGEKTMRMDMTMVYRFGDGTLLCEECFRREYPNAAEANQHPGILTEREKSYETYRHPHRQRL